MKISSFDFVLFRLRLFVDAQALHGILHPVENLSLPPGDNNVTFEKNDNNQLDCKSSKRYDTILIVDTFSTCAQKADKSA